MREIFGRVEARPPLAPDVAGLGAMPDVPHFEAFKEVVRPPLRGVQERGVDPDHVALEIGAPRGGPQSTLFPDLTTLGNPVDKVHALEEQGETRNRLRYFSM